MPGDETGQYSSSTVPGDETGQYSSSTVPGDETDQHSSRDETCQQSYSTEPGLDHNGCADHHDNSHGCTDAELVAVEEECMVPTACQKLQVLVEEEGEHIQRWKVTAIHFAQQIHQALGSGPANEELCNKFLKRCDFWTLNAGKWLNDQVT